MSRINDTNHYQIQGWMLNRLNLKGTTLNVYAIIYGFTQDGETEFNGSRQYLADFTGTSKPTIDKALDELCKLNYIIKTSTKINNITFNRFKANLSVLENFTGGKETLSVGGKETLHNNYILDTYNKEILKEISSTSVDTQEPKQVEIVSIDSANNTLDTTDKPIFNREDYILELFNKIWEKYPRKVNKQLAKKTWTKKFKGLKTQEEILEKARKIGTLFVQNQKQWVAEGRALQYIPHCSSWLSANVPDKE